MAFVLRYVYNFQVADAQQKRKKGMFGNKGGDKEVIYQLYL